MARYVVLLAIMLWVRVCRATFVRGELGGGCPRNSREITSFDDCNAAIAEIFGGSRQLFTSETRTIPRGCSFRERDARLHFNSGPYGRPRSDLIPVCERPRPGTPTVAPTPAPTTPWQRPMRINFAPGFNVQTITCPVLSAMVINGDLIPDAYGKVSRQQVFHAFRRIGISLETATDTTMGNFQHMPEPQEINIFDMDLPNPTRPLRTGNVEHDLSTGIRDGPEPNFAIFAAFERFIGEDGIWREENIEAAIEFFKTNPNDIGSGPGGLEAILVMFREFALDGTLSRRELRSLFVQHTYPDLFKARRDELVRGTAGLPDDEEEQQLGTDGDSEGAIGAGEVEEAPSTREPWTFRGCFLDLPEGNFTQVGRGPETVQTCAIICREARRSFFSLRAGDNCYCGDVCLLQPAPIFECSSACVVENGCGAEGRSSVYSLGSPESG